MKKAQVGGQEREGERRKARGKKKWMIKISRSRVGEGREEEAWRGEISREGRNGRTTREETNLKGKGREELE